MVMVQLQCKYFPYFPFHAELKLTTSRGTYYFLGGLCSELAAVGNFVLGNTFPVTFFGIYGAFFLSYGFTLTPYSGSTNPNVYHKGPEDPGFLASLGALILRSSNLGWSVELSANYRIK